MKNITTLAGTAAAALGASVLLAAAVAGPAAADTVAASTPRQATAVSAPASAAHTSVIGVDLAPNAIKVSGHAGKKVTVRASGEKTRAVTPKSASTPVTFTKLTAGKAYTISVDGRAVAKTTVLAAPGQTYNMVVQTIDSTPGSVLFTWDYDQVKNTGDVHFLLTATPVAGQVNTAVVSGQVPGSERAGILSGLDPHTIYTFSVEAVNDAAAGTNASAVMTRTLGDLTGADEAALRAAQDQADAAAKKAADDAAARATSTQPTSGGGGGGGAKAPAMRTIWECPTGFSDTGSDCTATRTYTFHTETQSTPYTYSTVQTGTRRNTDNQTCGYTPDAQGNPIVECWGGYDEPMYSTVKNGTPAGYTDNGSAWVRDVQVKDATPAGYSDSGSAWVKTTAKVSREVPA